MRKLAVVILAILYITLTSGVAVNLHYCMGQLASVKYGYDSHKKCSKCGMASKNKGCCHTESKLVKVDDAHQQPTVAVQFLQLPAEVPVAYFELPATFTSLPDHFIPLYHAPPDQRLNHVYLSNCVFRI